MTEQPPGLAAARHEARRAAEALRREEVLEGLRSRPGLAYAATSTDGLGPFLVAVDGVVIGEARSDQRTAVQGWYAVLYDGDRECEPTGPFPTIRAAAASLAR